MLFITLPSGRTLTYVKPKIGENQFGGESVTYEGVGSTKKWERIESYGPKFVENIVQAISRDILMYAIRTLSHCFIVGHVHDELIIETSMDASLEAICEQMGKTPPWIPGLLLRADGYETMFYKKLKKWQHPVPWVLPYFYSSEINSAANSLAFFILWIAVLFLSPNAFCTASVLPPS